MIHICFKTTTSIKFFQAEWSAGDVLAFYGVLVGAVATVWGVYLSIQYSRSNYQEDVKNRVLPFIALTPLKVRAKYLPPHSVEPLKLISKPIEYKEYKVEKIYYIIEKGQVSVKNHLTPQQNENVEKGGWRWETDASGTMQLMCIELVTLPLELENVGNGVANHFQIGLNSSTTDEKFWNYTTPMPLKVGETLNIHIYCEDGVQSKGSYVFDLIYEDIHGTKYRQQYGIAIDNPNDTIHSWIDFEGNQEQR